MGPVKNMLRRIFDRFAPVNARGAQGKTALIRAARAGNVNDVKKLISRGADPDITDEAGLTALHYAACWRETEIVRLLIAAGANVHAAKNGWTPLHSAALSGGRVANNDIVKALIAAGADVRAATIHGETPEGYMALWENKKDSLRLCMKKATRPDQQRKTPRHAADITSYRFVII